MISFEVFVADFWVAFEVQSTDIESVFANLASLPNVRNIQVS